MAGVIIHLGLIRYGFGILRMLLRPVVPVDFANRPEPYAYLRYIFEKLPLAVTLEDYEALLPWNINVEQMNATVNGVPGS